MLIQSVSKRQLALASSVFAMLLSGLSLASSTGSASQPNDLIIQSVSGPVQGSYFSVDLVGDGPIDWIVFLNGVEIDSGTIQGNSGTVTVYIPYFSNGGLLELDATSSNDTDIAQWTVGN